MEKVKKLPSNAKYDYTDVFGNKIYHTKSFRYTVKVKRFTINPIILKERRE